MYCSKCKFTSFDHVPSCPKCGIDWSTQKEALNLKWIEGSGYPWIKGISGSSEPQADVPAQEMEEANFEFEGPAPDQPSANENLQELSFDDFEEVNLGEADEAASSRGKTPAADESDMPEVSVQPDTNDDLLGTDLGDLENFDLELDDLQEQSLDGSSMDDADISLDDLDLDLEEASGKSSKG